MNYTKVFRTREIRLRVLRLLRFVPDKPMLKLQYRLKTGRKLNLRDPHRYTEKLQWLKLYYRNPLMIQCVDKYDVREYVESKGLGGILTPCYGVYERAEDIPWDLLPNSFVIKDTLGGGGNSVVLVHSKQTIDRDELLGRAKAWTAKKRVRAGGREWPSYSGKKHRIIIEQLLESNKEDGGLIDYKFLCFKGEPVILYVLADRELGKPTPCGIFGIDFRKLDVSENDEVPLKREIPKPAQYNTMVEIARTLSKDFPEARIDLYCTDKGIRFGEITFFDSSGYMKFEPDSFDLKLGEKFVLPEKTEGT